MGHTVTLNYIVKANIHESLRDLKPGKQFKIAKIGTRHYMMGCPLYLADPSWKIIGKCVVDQQSTANGFTAIECTLLMLFTKEESEVVTRLNLEGERLLSELK